jgi:uncharacterized protein (TIGR03000 family)
MPRWQALIASVALFGLLGLAAARGFNHCRTALPAPASDGVAGGDWSIGYQVDFSFAAVPPKPGSPGAVGQANAPQTASTPGTRRQNQPVAPPRLHVLLLIDDTNKDAGPANKAGAALFENTIRAGVTENSLGKIGTLSGADITLDRIRTAVNGLGVRPQDTIVGFYSGATDYDDATRTYTLKPAGGGRIRREDLRGMLLDRGAALTVLLTDTPAYRVVPEMLPPLQNSTEPFSLDRLLFRNRGIVDLQAAAANQTAFPRDGEGGLFTLALVDQLRQMKVDGPEPIWPELFDRVRATTDQMYVEYRRAVLTSDKVSVEDKRVYREQAHQTPVALMPFGRVKPSPPPAETIVTRPQQAEIVVRVPAGSRVFVEDRPTSTTGTERHFQTAALQPGRTYTYAIRAELDRDGKKLSETKRVTVKSGDTREIQFELAK